MRMDVGVRAAEIDDRRNRRSGTQKSTFRKGRSSPVESTDPRLAMIPGVAAPAPPGVLQSSPAPPTEEPPAAPPARCPTNVVLPWTASVIPQDDTMSDLGQLRYFMRIGFSGQAHPSSERSPGILQGSSSLIRRDRVGAG